LEGRLLGRLIRVEDTANVSTRAAIDRLVWVSGTNAKNDATLHGIEKILGVFFGL